MPHDDEPTGTKTHSCKIEPPTPRHNRDAHRLVVFASETLLSHINNNNRPGFSRAQKGDNPSFVRLRLSVHEALCPRTVPTLPTRPLVFRTALLLSVLRRTGEERLPTLSVPTPLPLRAGVRGGLLGLVTPTNSSPDPGRFSPSLVSEGASHFVVVVVVVVQETALRFALLRFAGEWLALRDSIRSAYSSSVSLDPRVRLVLTDSDSALRFKGWFSVMILRPP